MDNDFEINGKKFKMRKLDVQRQNHVIRRLGPVIPEFFTMLGSIAGQKDSNKSELEKFGDIAKNSGPFLNGLSKLSDTDFDYVFFRLLSSVEVQQEHGNWARVATDSQLMMQDLELPMLYNIAGRSFFFNYAGFLGGAPLVSRA